MEQEEPIKKPVNYTLWLISGVVGLMFMIVLGLILVGVSLVISSGRNIGQTPVPKEKMEEPAPLPAKKTPLATDSAVIKLQSDLGRLRSDIDSIDLFEPQLTLPNFDLDISIQTADNSRQ